MSQENVEIVRRFWEAWEQGNLEAVFAVYDPAVVWVSHTGPIEMRRTYVGHDGVRRAFQEFLEPFENVENHADTFIDAGESVVVGWQIVVAARRARHRFPCPAGASLTPTPEPAGYCAGDVAGERGGGEGGL